MRFNELYEGLEGDRTLAMAHGWKVEQRDNAYYAISPDGEAKFACLVNAKLSNDRTPEESAWWTAAYQVKKASVSRFAIAWITLRKTPTAARKKTHSPVHVPLLIGYWDGGLLAHRGLPPSVAQIKLFNPDHIAVIEGLVEIVAPDASDAIMTLIRAKASKEFL